LTGNLIEYITEILNIKTKSELVILDIRTELQEIEDIVSYKNYIKENLNHIDMQYMKGFQKFIHLTNLYKKEMFEIYNKDRLENAVTTAHKIADKVCTISKLSKSKAAKFEKFKTKDGNYFTSFEIKQLKRIGTVRECIKLQKSHSGHDPLLIRLEQSLKKLVGIEQIENKTSRKTKELIIKSLAK